MSALGTEFKINVHVEPIDGLHMSDYDFECEFFAYTNRGVKIPKSRMRKVDDDNYLAMITTELGKTIGRGTLKLRLTAYIPDDDFEDGVRTEVAEVCTGVTIV